MLDPRKLEGSESIEGSKTCDQNQIEHAATEFSNNKDNDATKNSNPEEKRRRERDLNSVVILEETKLGVNRQTGGRGFDPLCFS